MIYYFKKVWLQLKNCYLYFCRKAILLNGYVDDLAWKGINHRNWGDDLNVYLIEKMTGRPVILYHNFWFAKKLHLRNYLCIGTLLDAVNYSNEKTYVWGSGHSGQMRDFVHPKRVYSVRGPKTREILLQRNIECPNVLGDPALVLPLYYQPKAKGKKYKLGVIPHVIDHEHPVVKDLKQNHPDILIIDLANYQKWTDIIDQICSCDCIASSSLHGLIVSDTYGVPNSWIELTGNISGGYFKFHDYATSVSRTFDKPYQLTSVEEISTLIEICESWTSPVIDRESILAACPFIES